MYGVFRTVDCQTNPKKVFVLMPFASEFDAIYRLINRCCKEQGLECIRADEDIEAGKITDKIYYHIKSSGIVIADLTGRNANVFYELGLAHSILDDVILLTQSIPDVPFDLRDFAIIEYANTFDGAEELANKLSKLLDLVARSASLPGGEAQSIEELPVVPDEVLEGEDFEDFDFGMAHLRAEIARTSNNLPEAKRWLERARDAATKGWGDAGHIGNCAIEAERCRFVPLAEELYKRAIEIDPQHVNNRQSYVSFLLDAKPRAKGAKETAWQLLEELEAIPERQERTLGLKAQFFGVYRGLPRTTTCNVSSTS